MKRPDFLVVGHVTRDLIDGGVQSGGSVLYGSQVALRLGITAGIWTTAEKNFRFPPNVLVHSTPSPVTTTFTLEYDRKTGKRSEKCGPVAAPLARENVPKEWLQCRTVLIAPIYTELDPDAVTWFESDWVGLTPQGWFRYRDSEGNVTQGSSRWSSLPRKIRLLVVSEDDIRNDINAWTWIKKSARVAICTRGRKGHLVAHAGKETECRPPFVATESDPTGAGDTFATATLIALSEGCDPIQAARFGSAAASYVVEKPGLEGVKDRTQIEQRASLSS